MGEKTRKIGGGGWEKKLNISTKLELDASKLSPKLQTCNIKCRISNTLQKKRIGGVLI